MQIFYKIHLLPLIILLLVLKQQSSLTNLLIQKFIQEPLSNRIQLNLIKLNNTNTTQNKILYAY